MGLRFTKKIAELVRLFGNQKIRIKNARKDKVRYRLYACPLLISWSPARLFQPSIWTGDCNTEIFNTEDEMIVD